MTTVYDEFDTVWAPPDRAVAGDGSIHDSIQNAVDQGTGLVLIGPGTFEENVVIPNSTDQVGGVINGVGEATVIDGGSDHAFHVQADDVTVSRIGVQTTGGGGNTAHALHVSRSNGTVSDPRIDDITVLDSDSNGINLGESAGGWVTDCNVEQTDDAGIEVRAERCRISECYVGETNNDVGGAGIAALVRENMVVNNYIFAPAGDGVFGRGDDQLIASNLIDRVGDDGIDINGDEQLIHGNLIKGSSDTTLDQADATNTVVRDNMPTSIND